MIISGGFNIYPSDLEAVLTRYPGVGEASVVGAPSKAWGETPVAFVAAAPGASLDAEAAARAGRTRALGKTQRLAAVRLVERLPRSAIGKVLKRELRDAFGARTSDRCGADQALAGCFTATPASVSIAASSPDWNISVAMSAPPTNSPLM